MLTGKSGCEPTLSFYVGSEPKAMPAWDTYGMYVIYYGAFGRLCLNRKGNYGKKRGI